MGKKSRTNVRKLGAKALRVGKETTQATLRRLGNVVAKIVERSARIRKRSGAYFSRSTKKD